MSDPMRHEGEGVEMVPPELREIAGLLDRLGAAERAGAGERLGERVVTASAETLAEGAPLVREMDALGEYERAAAPSGFEAAVFAASRRALPAARRGAWGGMVVVRRTLALAAAVAVVGAGVAVYLASVGNDWGEGGTVVAVGPREEGRASSELALLVDEELNDLLAVLETAASPSPEIGRFRAELESAVLRLDRPANLVGWGLIEGSAL